MSRVGVVFLGLVLFTLGAGVLVYRVYTNPEILVRYERAILDRDGGSLKTAPAPAPQPGGAEDSSATDATDSRRVAPRKKLGGLKIFEILLDLANVFIGLVGIGLAITGMRMRAEAKRA